MAATEVHTLPGANKPQVSTVRVGGRFRTNVTYDTPEADVTVTNHGTGQIVEASITDWLGNPLYTYDLEKGWVQAGTVYGD